MLLKTFGESEYQWGEFLQKKFRHQYRKEIARKIKVLARSVNAQKN